MYNILLVVVVVSQLGQSLAYYDNCPGVDIATYVTTGILSEQYRCNGTCIPVDSPCQDLPDKCYQGDGPWTTFHLWENVTCVRGNQWSHCDSSTTGSSGRVCRPGTEGCQPSHVPCGGKCNGGGYYTNWWKCPGEENCILAALVCSGLGPFCKDGSDQMNQTCSANTNTECPRVHSLVPPARSERCDGDRPRQCVAPASKGIDCLDHSDNYKLKDELKSTSEINNLIKNLTKCVTSGGNTGLQCDNGCIWTGSWCNPTSSISKSCKIQDTEIEDVRHAGEICQDKNYWQDIECGSRRSRCSGTHPGQCYYNGDQCVVKVGYGTCLDSSHRVCEKDSDYDGRSGQDVCKEEEITMWKCEDGGGCIDNKLLCDGTPHCSDGSDESSSQCSCPISLEKELGPDILQNRGVSAATVQCEDIRFPSLNIFTCAVKCDGRKECFDGRDEKGCKENEVLFWSCVGVIVLLFVAISILLVHKAAPNIQKRIDKELHFLHTDMEMEAAEPEAMNESTTRLIQLITNSDKGPREDERQREMMSIMKNLHNLEDFSGKIQMIATTLQLHPQKTEMERRNKVLYDLELAVHKGNHTKTLICMKNQMGTNEVTEAVIKGTTPGFTDKIVKTIGSWKITWPQIPNVFGFYPPQALPQNEFTDVPICCCVTQQRVFQLGRWFNTNKAVQYLTAFCQMAFYYVDLLKDLVVVYVMFRLNSTTDLPYGNFLFTFNGILLILMVFTVTIAILITSIFLSASYPGVELQLCGVKKSSILKSIRFLTFLISIFVPTTLIYQLTRKKILLKDLEERLANAITNNEGQVDLTLIVDLQLMKEKVHTLAKLTFLKQKNDLILEVTIQTSISIVMIMVVQSHVDSLTETGLQAIFSDSTLFLTLGFLLSIKKIVTSNLALVAAEKQGFLPFAGKILKAAGYLLAALMRIGAVTLFCGLPLGILNILVHKSSLSNYNLATRTFIYDAVKQEDGSLSVLRMNETYNVYHYTQLTGLTLGWYGVIFFIGIIVHICLVTLVKKLVFGEGFSELSFMEKFLHILHTVAFPEASIDWDYGNTGTLQTYKRQWQKFQQESVFMVTLHAVENILMAVPVVLITTNVSNYHEMLPYTTELEKGAYSTARQLRIIWPTVVVIAPILQWLLVIAYNKYGHPWKVLFAQFDQIGETGDEEIGVVEENQELLGEQMEEVGRPEPEREEATEEIQE